MGPSYINSAPSLLQFIPGEEGLSLVSQTVATFSQVFVTWMGPFLPVLGLVHPDFLKPITTASGTLTPGGGGEALRVCPYST